MDSKEKIAMADAWGRELARKEKQAFLGADDVAGAAIGYQSGKNQSARGESHSFGMKQLGSLLLPGGAGYQVGRYVGHGTPKAPAKPKGKKGKTKKAGLFNDADKASKFVGRASRLWEKHGPAVKNMAGKAGKGAHDAVKAVGERIGKIQSPISRGAAYGATIGGVAGGLSGAISPDRDPYTGEKKRLKTMLSKGLAGAATGGATGAITGSMQKSSAILEKAAAGVISMGGLGSMAKNFVAQAKPMAQKAMTAAAPHIQAGAKALGGASMGQAAGVGAAAGGALGAAKGLVAPGRDAQGRTNSRIGGMARGAIRGAAGGAAMGAGAKALQTRMR